MISKKDIKDIMNFGVELTNSLVLLFFKVIMIFGALAALILLKELYPAMAEIILTPLQIILIFIFKFILVSLLSVILIAICYYTFIIFEPSFAKLKKSREKRREKFLNDLAKKLNRKLKK